MDIKKVVVIGSGTMGSGIAAHLCNANVPVTLLDLTTEISENEEEANNDLSEFGVNSDSPDLFSSDSDSLSSNDLLSSEDDEKEDDLEIPAFLRRQKN